MIVVVRSANERSLARSFAEQTTTYFRRRRINSQPLRERTLPYDSFAEQTTTIGKIGRHRHTECARYFLSVEWLLLDRQLKRSVMRYSFILCLLLTPTILLASDRHPPGWTTESPRDEIRPSFSWDARGGVEGHGALSIAADDRDGLMGHWQQTLPVRGDEHFRFSVYRQTDKIGLVRRAAIVRIIWLDDQGQRVVRRDPTFTSYRKGQQPRAEPEFPSDGETVDGWTEVTAVYQAPPQATRAQIELHFRWGPPNSSVTWSLPKL